MATKKPAAAGQQTAAKKPASPRVVAGVELKRMPMQDNQPSHPIALFKGEAPNKGDVLEFTLENGVTYRGTVADATEAGGEVLAEFSGPLVPVPTE